MRWEGEGRGEVQGGGQGSDTCVDLGTARFPLSAEANRGGSSAVAETDRVPSLGETVPFRSFSGGLRAAGASRIKGRSRLPNPSRNKIIHSFIHSFLCVSNPDKKKPFFLGELNYRIDANNNDNNNSVWRSWENETRTQLRFD